MTSIAFRGGAAVGLVAGIVVTGLIYDGRPLPPQESAPPPEPRVVEVIKEKEVIVEVPVEVLVPFPESCLSVLKLTQQIADLSATNYDRYSEALTYLHELDVRSLSDLDAVHKTEDGMNERKKRMEMTLLHILEMNSDLHDRGEMCRSDVRDQRD